MGSSCALSKLQEFSLSLSPVLFSMEVQLGPINVRTRLKLNNRLKLITLQQGLQIFRQQQSFLCSLHTQWKNFTRLEST